MSEYLGWTERRPAQRSKSYGSDLLPGGPVTSSYESYVKNIFHPSNRLKRDSHQMATDKGISASTMLKMERTLGRGALDDKYDDDLLKTPLEAMYDELGLKSNDNALYRNYQVYVPKQSSEYYAIAYGNMKKDPNDLSFGRGVYSSYKDKADEDYEKNNHKTIIDYKGFESSPLSPYLYQSHPYVRSQDSRIIGSNFVQVTSRPKDRFLDKIDQTLAEVRAMPRYC
ncbi:unnamed protein product [Auanema sp. JU1783]|nr:unnamed protein product [Auanema sp. JU1783]